jgi:hypothetical protein
VAPTNGQITLAANALGTSTPVTRTVIISTSGGTLSAAVGAAVGITISGATTVTLTGNEQALSNYLSTANNLRFNGTVGQFTLTVTVQARTGATVDAAITRQALLSSQSQVVYGSSGAVVAVPTLVVPTQFVVSTVNGQISLGSSALGTSTTATRTVVISTSGGSLSAAVGASVGVASAVSGVTSVTLTGTESALSSYLATANNLRFTGSMGDYTLTISSQVKDGTAVVSESVRSVPVRAATTVVQAFSSNANQGGRSKDGTEFTILAAGGGGGGASTAGGDGYYETPDDYRLSRGGVGGNGRASDITGGNVTYAGGGGGGSDNRYDERDWSLAQGWRGPNWSNGGAGGTGGGGYGSRDGNGGAGSANTGSGGGGAGRIG